MSIMIDRVNTTNFSYNKKEKIFTADLSELKHYRLFGRLYDDACDQGFVLVSNRTGVGVRVYRDESLEAENPHNAEEEMVFYFRPVNPNHKFTVVIFND